ncbi:unnamed protein product [Macrosiphum euphorbiae]|uniref:Reverse transcriptase domain-containing protein n=1 Tax=Macrosiphum euphorbiae TaxID=13131 RepID=A0AAV0W9W5_9HEMI|nr:unnamed protein product [Macrosiphum euphorbiae]
MLRKDWQALLEHMKQLFGRCLQDGTFTECWKTARLVIINNPSKDDLGKVKSYLPISLLPILGKALELMVIQEITRETDLDSQAEQHRFTAGKSTISAVESVYTWIDASKCRNIFLTFLDITSTFDHVKWSPLLAQLKYLGASISRGSSNRTLKNRWADFELEGVNFKRRLERE